MHVQSKVTWWPPCSSTSPMPSWILLISTGPRMVRSKLNNSGHVWGVGGGGGAITHMFKLVHYVFQTVGKRMVGIWLKHLFVRGGRSWCSLDSISNCFKYFTSCCQKINYTNTKLYLPTVSTYRFHQRWNRHVWLFCFGMVSL